MSMQTKTLGNSQITVSSVGMGCWAIGGPFWLGKTPLGWGEVDDAESIQAVNAAFDNGITFFDTADIYGAGHSERVLAQALKDKRNSVVIASKFGFQFNENTKQVVGQSAKPEYIRSACAASLKRLETDYIDLYQFHLNDHPIKDVPEIIDTLETLVDEGKIRFYGWSTDFPDRALAFTQGQHCISAQFQMNVIDTAQEMIKICENNNLAGINRGPLAMGILTGKYTPDNTVEGADVRSKAAPEWMKYFKDGVVNPEWYQKLETVREHLTYDGRTLTQGALSWLLTYSKCTLPIPGCRTAAQAAENAQTLQLSPLSNDAMQNIAALLS